MCCSVEIVYFMIILHCYGGSADHPCSFFSTSSGLYANCSQRGLSRIPTLNHSVVYLDLSHNHITNGSSGARLPTGLHTLDMSHNSVEVITGIIFQGLYNLLKLDISHNNFKYSYDNVSRQAFRDLRSLQDLNMKGNTRRTDRNISFLGDALQHVRSLRSLRMDGVRSAMPSVEFHNLTLLTYLDISGSAGYCGISYLTRNFFEYTGSVKWIDLSFCQILRIEQGTFVHLRNLQFLDLSYNEEMTFRPLRNVTYDLQFTSIETFRFDKVHCTFGVGTYIDLDSTISLRNTSIRHLSLASNRIELVQEGVIRHLPASLQNLSIGDNPFTKGMFIFEVNSLKNLKVANVTNTFTVHFPIKLIPRCNDTRDSYTGNTGKGTKPNRAEKQRMATKFPPIPLPWFIVYLPPKLETIYGNRSNFRYFIHEWHIGNNSLKHLYMQENILYNLSGPIHGLDKLELLDLSNNFCSYLSTKFFLYTLNLKQLNLSNNFLGYILEKDVAGNSFKTLVKLEILDLSNNKIRQIPFYLFRNLVRLRCLYLQGNLMQSWQPYTRTLKFIEMLDLSDNQLHGISTKTISEFETMQNLTLRIVSNPFLCDCNNLYFFKWILSNRRVIYGTNDETFCLFPNGTKVESARLGQLLTVLEKDCSKLTWLIVLSTAVVFVSVTIVIGGIVYRYRWKLRYIYYMAKRNHQRASDHVTEEYREMYRYDAFISYADDKRQFVVTKLSKILEDEYHLKLCIHHRDFLPGVDIAENITNAIHESKMTICMLSNEYLRSYWCMFELNMGRMESIYSRGGENVLFLILLKDFTVSMAPLSLMNLIDSKSYIEYPDDEEGDVVFWEKIVEVLTM